MARHSQAAYGRTAAEMRQPVRAVSRGWMRTDIRSAICARCIPTGRRCSRMFRINSATVLCRMTRWNWRLIEAWVAGGNYILAMEPHYREALLKKDAEGGCGVGAARAHGSVAEGKYRAVPAACRSDRDGARRARTRRRRSPICCTGGMCLPRSRP